MRFRKLFPWVKEFAPWDEATHSTQPTAHNPWLAASYYNVLAAHCPGCEVTAPDILDSDGNVEAWVGSFLERAHPYPKIWPFNPYHSVSVGSPVLIEQFLAAVHGQVWFSEVGGVVWWRFKGRLIDHGEAYAARVATTSSRSPSSARALRESTTTTGARPERPWPRRRARPPGTPVW